MVVHKRKEKENVDSKNVLLKKLIEKIEDLHIYEKHSKIINY